MWKKYLGNEGGYALVIAVLAITIITVLGLSVAATTTHSKNSVVKEDKNQTAYYIAESGLNLKKEELQKKITDVYTQFEKDQTGKKMTSAEFITAFQNHAVTALSTVTQNTSYVSKNISCSGCIEVFERANSKALVKTETKINGMEITYTIKSTGTVDQQKRTVTTSLPYTLTATATEVKPTVVDDNFSKYAIHSTGTLTINEGKVNGDLGFTKNIKMNYNFPFTNNSSFNSYTGGTGNLTYKACLDWETNANPPYCKNNKNFEDAPVAIANKAIVLNDSKLPTLPDFPLSEFLDSNVELGSGQISGKLSDLPKLPNKGTVGTGNYIINTNNNNKNYDIDIGSNKVTIYSVNTDTNKIDILPLDMNAFKLNIAGTGELTIYTKSFNLKGNTVDFHTNKVDIISSTSVILDDSPSIKAKKLTIKTPSLTIKNSAITVSESIKMYVNTELILEGEKPITSSQTDIYYKGAKQAEIRNKFNNKFNFYSLYSGFSLNDNAAIIGDINVYGLDIVCPANQNCSKDIYFNDSADLSKESPIYVNAPNSNIKFRLSILHGAFVGKDVSIEGQAQITLVPKKTSGSTNSNSPETSTPTTGAGTITSTLTNQPTGSVEVD